ncbi:hypothetical protein [Roseobacter ponti]|uniref:Uncharacterized protein n=1 Tax=Roseobacter ponti TaxID=1891787 RepID=A0A858SR43_9RHOB|nr:hypothetical protein [Roseobacter ponti]QJF50348.1 hypothetical protein G3256_03795 [Roseobacter ponti]
MNIAVSRPYQMVPFSRSGRYIPADPRHNAAGVPGDTCPRGVTCIRVSKSDLDVSCSAVLAEKQSASGGQIIVKGQPRCVIIYDALQASGGKHLSFYRLCEIGIGIGIGEFGRHQKGPNTSRAQGIHAADKKQRTSVSKP